MRPIGFTLGFVVACALVACGRIRFDPLGDGALGGGGDAPAGLANRVFVTAATMPGTFGGLSGADAICQDTASMHGMTGTFIAFLSTSSMDARTRIAGSRGWVRTDGMPFADTFDGLLAGQMFSALVTDESGTVMPAASASAWTGSSSVGTRVATATCNDWTSPTGSPVGEVGTVGGGILEMFDAPNSVDCTSTFEHLYCFEVGKVVSIGPQPQTGRRAFISQAMTIGTGLSGLDMVCQNEAGAAGLSGTFLAAVSTSATTTSSRFATDSMPWLRPDGALVARIAPALFDGSDLVTQLDQAADSTYILDAPVVTGGPPNAIGNPNATCGDWQNTGGASLGGDTNTIASPPLWNGTDFGCDTDVTMLCLEQ